MKAKGNSGRHISSAPAYGYKKDPEDSSHWLIDEEAAEVVRRIYRMTVEGYTSTQIADQLEAEKVERPSYYLDKHGYGTYRNHCDMSRKYFWRASTIRLILSRPEYIGKTVNFRTFSTSYKDKKRRRNSTENWAVFDNTQEPIIDEKTWNLVQQLLKTKRRTDNRKDANPFTGLVYCADCGEKMSNHRYNGSPILDEDGNDTGKRRPAYDYYCCRTSINARMRKTEECSKHFIRTEVLRSLVLDCIRYAGTSAIENEDEFRKRIYDTHLQQQADETKEIRKQLERDQKRYDELDTLIQSLYEANVSGKISDRRYKMLADKYENEQGELEIAISEAQTEIAEVKTCTDEAENFIDLAKKYTDFSELTPVMLNEFVDKILVHEPVKVEGEREQEVEIYLNFIGKVTLPEPELTAEELEEARKKKEQRAKGREKARRYRKRQKQKKLAAAKAAEGDHHERTETENP